MIEFKEILGWIYGNILNLLQLYSDALDRYLLGWDCNADAWADTILYNRFGLIAILTSAILAGFYYYVWCPVRRQRLWWFLLLLINAIVNAIIGFTLLNSDYEEGLIGDCLIYDDNGQQVIDTMDFVWFGFVNAILAIVLFYFFSWAIKWGSRTGKYYPCNYPF